MWAADVGVGAVLTMGAAHTAHSTFPMSSPSSSPQPSPNKPHSWHCASVIGWKSATQLCPAISVRRARASSKYAWYKQ
eukprot:CAMPEP_0198604294 /NCGR_PEP_ID=MMETSP1462-20131121/153013_1 /TAXON_ID=1333877 /ORGANISM="Brandtodinium nutriculum, Strain RCC3387" /LENGTH=77 /DNA_ID=CAMNT_0044336077 /DNA_START=271 /DNA_END=501 /DNA_ORIENTATION=-